MLNIKLLTDVAFYQMPEDGDDARKAFEIHCNLPGESWYEVYGCTMPEVFAAIKDGDKSGYPQHVLADHMQETGHSEASQMKDLAAALTVGLSDLTIGTAGIYTHQASQILHDKVVVKKLPNGTYVIWWGSVNFSPSGWNQSNAAMVFACEPWALAFIEKFRAHRAYCQLKEPQYQLFHFAAAETDLIEPSQTNVQPTH